MFLLKKYISYTFINIQKPYGHENSSSSVHLMIYSQPCWWDKIFLFKLRRSADVLTLGLGWKVCLFGVNLSHPVCGCLLMFGWSWRDFCIHNTFFRRPAGEPQRTSFARLGWDQKWSWMLGFSCGCTTRNQMRSLPLTGRHIRIVSVFSFCICDVPNWACRVYV